jgi:ABC-2 type transport system permease protein
MRVFFILLGKELRSFFFSPIAYVVLALFMVINGFSFYQGLGALNASQASEHHIAQWVFFPRYFFFYFFFVFPLITMRLFAEETKLGTLEALLTAPVRTSQVLLAKYCSALVFYIVLWLPNMIYFLLVRMVTNNQLIVPMGSVFGAYVILFSLGLFHIAIGCLASAMTRNQIVAAILCFTLTLLHFLVGAFLLYHAKNATQEAGNILQYVATDRHMELFTKGVIDSRPVVYYASFAGLLLAVTHQVLEYRRWKA